MRVILLSLIASLVGAWPQSVLPDFDDGPGLDGLSQYVFSTYRSTVVRTGGIAGIERTFGIRGWFSLEVDVEAGTASLLPVDARLVDSAGSVCLQSLDDTFNLTQLAGTIVDDYSIHFAGQTSDGSAVSITLDFLQDGSVRLHGETAPPPNSADFFIFTLDAVGRRSCPTDGACSSDVYPASSEYVVLADRSTVTRIAGCVRPIQKAFAMGGRFRLLLDFASGTARFDRVEGNLIDASREEPNRPVDEVLNLSGLTGTLAGDGSILFEGQDFWNADVRLISSADGGCAYLSGRIAPPWTTTASPVLYLDVVAQRRYGGGTGEPNDPYLICTAAQLNAIGADPNDWDKHFKLLADIDLSVSAADASGMAGSSYSMPFRGTFDGDGHVIRNLTITESAGKCIGLFGTLGRSGHIRNLELADARVVAHTYVGALVGYNAGGTIQNCRIVADVQGVGYTGGITGISIDNALICDCHANVRVSGQSYETGGIAGANSGSTITRCSAAGTVTGRDNTGGVTGRQDGGSLVSDSSSTCSVTGGRRTGGILGRNAYSTVSGCFATGDISGVDTVGGLVGFSDSEVSDCWAAARVSGGSSVGGLIGENVYGFVLHSYSRTVVGGGVEAGGLVGRQQGRGFYEGCFYDSDVDVLPPAVADTAGIYAKPSAELMTERTFTQVGWDFVGETANGTEDIWWILEGQDYPRLWWEREDEAPS